METSVDAIFLHHEEELSKITMIFLLMGKCCHPFLLAKPSISAFKNSFDASHFKDS